MSTTIPMKIPSLQSEIRGTRTGYVIRFTCPACETENIIVIQTAMDQILEVQVARCAHCRMQSAIRTPPSVRNRTFPPVDR